MTAATKPTLSTAEPPSDLGHPKLVAAMRAEIDAAGGRIPFARFMELALYHPRWGYYRSPAYDPDRAGDAGAGGASVGDAGVAPTRLQTRGPGRPGDFLTAPETHPFFGAALARQVAECWQRLDRPQPFVVREYGAGSGALAWDIINGLADEAPACRAALAYRLVETNPHRLAAALAALTEAGLGDVVQGEAITPGADPEPIVGVVLANEVADAFGVHRLIWRDGDLREGWVVWDGDRFAEEEGELSAEAAAAEPERMLREAGIALDDGDRIEIAPAAASWFATAARGLDRGYAIVIDYGYPAAVLYQGHRREGTVRAYHGHTVGADPFARVGEQDLTAHVDFSALRRAGEAAGLVFVGQTTQGAFLASLEMGDLLVALGREPQTTLPDYLAAQAAVLRLIDPGGMGRFGVLVMARDAPVSPPLRGFTIAPLTF